MLSDTKTLFSKNYGWAAGMGDRNGRWAIVVDKDGKFPIHDTVPLEARLTVSGSIIYAENEESPSQVTVSLTLSL